MRYLGIDYGLRNIGLAIGDDETFLAGSFDTIFEDDLEKQIDEIARVVKDQDIDAIVAGYPLTMEGLEEKQAEETLTFLTELSGHLSIPVYREDERLTSSFARRQLKEYRSGVFDEHAIAAAAILQTYLDRKRGGDSSSSASN